ncbi:MAG TPA: DUF4391 domain-containing protein [Allosphingosinicella sp.]|jgi:hypothetical protein|nr:DUF4391 domain-containing protein [Allosphingosinicella sp.]
MTALFAWPEAARVGSRIPRDVLFRRAGGGKTIRALYERQVERIDWAFKLFERSVNLPAGGDVSEIQVIHVHLRGETLDDRILAHLDKGLPRQTWFELVRSAAEGDEVQAAAAYKRPSHADRGRIVTGEHWRTAWAPSHTPRLPLPPAVTLERLYAGLLQSLWPHPARRAESLADHAERLSRVAAQAKTVARLEAQVGREPDFAARVERNRALRAARAALKELTNPR